MNDIANNNLDTSGIIQLIVLIILIIFSAFFSSAETSLSTANRVRLRTMAEDGNKRAIRVEKILNKYSKMLSTILIGNNIVNISASALATSLTIKAWGNAFVGVVTGILTFWVLIFGEIVPKSWAKIKADSLALAYSGIIGALMIVLTPIVFIVDKIARGILYLIHIDPDEQDDQITEDELKTYVDVSHEGGEIETEEHEMIYNVLDFSDSEAEEVMIPQEDVISVDVEASYHELMESFREKKIYTRIPVWEENSDNYIGIVNIKDLIYVENKEDFNIRKIMREPFFTVEHKKTSDLMVEMREKCVSMAFVLNEYGSCVGVITMEDLLEEIVGEIRDEYDEEEEKFIQEISIRTFLIEASMKIYDVNDSIDTEFESKDYDSIGGLMIEQLERLPEDGEVVELKDGTLLQAKGIHQNRIEKVLLTLPEPKVDTDDDSLQDSEEDSQN